MGGRIFISYTGTDTFSVAGSGSGTFSVDGGDNSGGAVGGLSGSAVLYDSTNQDYFIVVTNRFYAEKGDPNLSGRNFKILNSSTLYIRGDSSTNSTVTMTFTNLFTVESGSTINVNGRGYPGCFTTCTSGTNGPGRGDYREGGSYGGIGGRSSIDRIYGTYNTPAKLGSGGGGGGGSTTGTAGGGAIVLTVGSLDVDGTITAKGADNSGSASTGSGGTIKATISGNFSGTGSILADGGGKPTNSEGGTGGGGRIYISYTGTDTFSVVGSGSGTLSADGGDNSGGATAGAPGTVILYDSTNQDYFLVSDNSFYGATDPDLTGRNFELSNSSTLHSHGDPSTNSAVSFSLTGDFTVEVGSTIDANGRGLPTVL